ncbi:helix-turn-helix transcriptional regulator [Herbiconiux daphne]|uniref:Helix-turn-helix transcriptional regulator n=1 Tax=Herbiconiux daphne TaxID=2970914 RepID=A0ABT2GZ09_9MICO|nr:helix-turn-helix transcriptional regulator [Herbiconiux daphne]MCS5732295.1 helix-turn-helix transcriptional regulator [Herbiconiux daphne]
MIERSELGAFLQAQRARLRPADVGLAPDQVPRRVPGLRREEVARLAGLSTDYYTRLEQGRKDSPSEGVLNAIARALHLDEIGRQHLLDLARPVGSVTAPRTPPAQRVRASTRQLMESWADQPALLLGRRLDVLATNALGRALLFDFGTLPPAERNYLRWLMLHPHARVLYRDWESVASEMVAALRREAGRHPDDPSIIDLVGELVVRSEEFAGWWADQRVTAHTHGVKRFHHELVGDLELDWQGLALPGDEDQTIYVYHAPPGSPAAEKLGLLGSWIGSAPAAAGRNPETATGAESAVDEPA